MSKTTVPTLKREHNVGENEITKKLFVTILLSI